MGIGYGFCKKESYHPTVKIIVRKVRKVKEKNMLVARMHLESIPVQIPREVAVVVEICTSIEI
jgi:hypothetical protein